MSSKIALVAVAAACTPALAAAQPVPPPPQADQPIIVTGERPVAESSIDRKSYSVAHDLQAQSGSVADVLRNLPSVDVDAQGNVSLRGDQNVQILIDGKPSTSMNAANRAETIQQIPANAVDRVEVMTNPSAQFKPDGSSGLINIITKKSRKAGTTGTVQASVGSDGRFNFGVTVAHNSGPLTVNGGLTLRRDVAKRPFSDRRRRVDAATGQEAESTQDSLFLSKRLSRIATLGVDYDLSRADSLSAALSYNVRTGKPRIDEQDHVADGSGATVADYHRIGLGWERETNSEGSLTYRHAFSGKDHELSVQVRRSESAETQHRRYTSTYDVPSQQIVIEDQSPHADEVERELSVDYSGPTAGNGKLQLGYDLERNDDVYDHSGGSIDPSSGFLTSIQH